MMTGADDSTEEGGDDVDLLGLLRLVLLALRVASQHAACRCVDALLVRPIQLIPQKHAAAALALEAAAIGRHKVVLQPP